MFPRLLILLCFISNLAIAAPLTPEKIPAALEDWAAWVLHDETEWKCPLFANRQARQCYWPAQLELQVSEQGGDFTQVWQVYAEGRIDLPGNQRHWPLDVKINDQAAIVSEHNNIPGVHVLPGRYRISGRFSWDKLPEYLSVPPHSALVQLTVKGTEIALPRFDAQGRIWLKQNAPDETAEQREENRLDMRVYRHIVDTIPLRMNTRIELDVAGKAREIVLGPVFDSAAWQPMSLQNPLPARIEADGRLRLQVRPGSWVFTLSARHLGETKQLRRPQVDSEWPEQEVWVFEARSDLRAVDVDGRMLDPQQTGLPSEWRKFPAYQVLANDILTLNETRRGDADPAPNQLHLQRDIWLDFEGYGYTIKDRISGQMNSDWRLEMGAPGRLGRVSINQQDQFITRLGSDNSAPTGVEIRHGTLNLEADSRINDALRSLPIVGWLHDFQHVEATLRLPPGWRVLHVAGADTASTTWLRQWNLLNIFIVLITAIAVAKLWHWGWGVLTLLTLVLIFHENDAPRWVFLNIIAALALLRVLPDKRWFTGMVRRYRDVSLLALLFIAVPFMVDQARQSLYPQLEHPWLNVSQQYQTSSAASNNFGDNLALEAPQAEMEEQSLSDDAAGFAADKSMPQQAMPAPLAKRNAVSPYSLSREPKTAYKAKKQLRQIDPNAQIQTGPGLPQWHWNTVRLRWNGPVDQSQHMRLYLLPPVFTSLLGMIRVILMTALLVFFLYAGWRSFSASPPPSSSSASTAKNAARQASTAVVLIGLLCLPLLTLAGGKSDTAASATDSLFPPPALLQTLKERLTSPPTCFPHCVSTPRLHIELHDDELRLHQEVHAQSHSAVPLPGQAQHWLPQQVWINGQADNTLWRDAQGMLWLDLSPGIHHLMLEGILPKRASVQLALPLPPHNVSVESQGWRVEGVHENGAADRQLQFSRETPADATADTLDMGTLPPFAQVERTLRMALDWQVETTVRRLTPAGSAVVLEIPLLPGESVTSEAIRVEDGKALINMSPGQTTLSWESVFAKQDIIELTAPDTHAWHETWQLDISPIWHVRLEGIPVVQQQSRDGRWQPQWRPWPGESVTLHFTRPRGVAGQITTIDNSHLRVAPGKRVTQSTLRLNLRSSRGGYHPITLPKGAELQQVRINNKAQPLRLEGRQLNIPLTPGGQNIEIIFNQAHGIDGSFFTPAIDLGMPSVNAQIELEVPHSRWLFFVGGPAIGPAVLFWGVLVILLLASIGLARAKVAPLRAWQWFLLGLVVATQTHIPAVLIIVAWFIGLQWRAKLAVSEWHAWQFNLLQVVLVGISVMAATLLLISLQQGLLGHPDMQILGNGSSRTLLRWYQDRIDAQLPQAWMMSAPLFVYRIAMLAWALWLAFALLKWLRWGWLCFSGGAIWRPMTWRRRN